MESFKGEIISLGMNAFNNVQRIKQKIREDFNKVDSEDRMLTGDQSDYESCLKVDIEMLTELLDRDESRMR